MNDSLKSLFNRRVAILYTHFPHYRRPVFRKLKDSGKYQFTFFYDPEGIDPTILSSRVDGSDVCLSTYKLGPFMFQPAFLPLTLWGRFDACIMLGNPYILTNWLYAVILRFRGCKVLMWTHGWQTIEGGWKGWIRDIYYRLANSLLLYGNRAREIGIAKGFDPERLHVIYNSLDYDMQCYVRNQLLNIDRDGPKFFLCVTRLVPEVSLELAIKALAIVNHDAKTTVRLVVVGDGPERQVLEQLARIEQVDVDFLGPVYDEVQLAKLFSTCVAVVSPGKAGLLVMHALAYGAPIITHSDFDFQMPEVEAVVPNRTGSFFKRGDIISLADEMLAWLAKEIMNETKLEAFRMIESRYTPHIQKNLIESAIGRLLNAG